VPAKFPLVESSQQFTLCKDKDGKIWQPNTIGTNSGGSLISGLFSKITFPATPLP
jgi:hypothetical protein